jgi:hypothetical protein
LWGPGGGVGGGGDVACWAESGSKQNGLCRIRVKNACGLSFKKKCIIAAWHNATAAWFTVRGVHGRMGSGLEAPSAPLFEARSPCSRSSSQRLALGVFCGARGCGCARPPGHSALRGCSRQRTLRRETQGSVPHALCLGLNAGVSGAPWHRDQGLTPASGLISPQEVSIRVRGAGEVYSLYHGTRRRPAGTSQDVLLCPSHPRHAALAAATVALQARRVAPAQVCAALTADAPLACRGSRPQHSRRMRPPLRSTAGVHSLFQAPFRSYLRPQNLGHVTSLTLDARKCGT